MRYRKAGHRRTVRGAPLTLFALPLLAAPPNAARSLPQRDIRRLALASPPRPPASAVRKPRAAPPAPARLAGEALDGLRYEQRLNVVSPLQARPACYFKTPCLSVQWELCQRSRAG